ncbi:MAG: hypothetical protein ACI9KN_000297 [Gammaproteobacteria bacterium]|jgi:hypothetical protein
MADNDRFNLNFLIKTKESRLNGYLAGTSNNGYSGEGGEADNQLKSIIYLASISGETPPGLARWEPGWINVGTRA